MTFGTEKTLPASLNAERAVLGAILLNNDAVNPASEALIPDDFYGEAHRVIFEAMVALSDDNSAIDAVTVAERLERSGELARAGGLGYLSTLMDGLPRALNVAEYARIVKEKSSLRKLISSANSIITSAMNGAGDLEASAESLSSHLRERVRQERNDIGWRTAADALDADMEDTVWVVAPYVAAGAITDLAGPPKASGKTTFALHLCRSVVDGERFMGGAVRRGPVVYLTEETGTTFTQAMRRARLLACKNFHWLTRYKVKGMPWPEVVAAAVAKATEVDAVLIVVDTAPTFMGFEGEGENAAGEVLAAMRPLQDAAAEGFAVLTNRHERKSGGAVGTAGRGSSAYTGAVDIVLGLRRPSTGTRRGVRELHALSRFDETPDLLVIELTDGGYTSRGTASSVAFEDAKAAIERVTPKNAAEARTRDDLHADIDVNVSRSTLNRAVDELLERRVLKKVGEGRRGDPYKYFLFKVSSVVGKESNENEDMAREWATTGTDAGNESVAKSPAPGTPQALDI